MSFFRLTKCECTRYKFFDVLNAVVLLCRYVFNASILYAKIRLIHYVTIAERFLFRIAEKKRNKDVDKISQKSVPKLAKSHTLIKINNMI